MVTKQDQDVSMKIAYLLALTVALPLQGCAINATKALLKSYPNTSTTNSKNETGLCANKEVRGETLTNTSRKGVVVIESGNSTGSGFLFESSPEESLILTNSHVINNELKVTVELIDGRSYPGTVISNAGGEEWENDIAIVKAPFSSNNTLKLSDKLPLVGSDVYAIGAPEGLNFSVTKGIVSSLRGEKNELIQLDAALNPGNSGGPVMNTQGCVIGMSTFIQEESEGLNFALSAVPLKNFVNSPYQIATAPRNVSPSTTASESQGNDTARKTNCWFQMKPADESLTGSHCSIKMRSDSGDHKIYEMIDSEELRRVIVLWDNETVEVILDGNFHEGSWWIDEEEDVIVELKGGTFAFTPTT